MKNFFLLLLAIAALVAAGVTLFKNGDKKVDATLSIPFEMLGKVLAEETLREVPGQGTIYVLRYRSAISPDNPVLNPAAETFLRTIRKDGRLNIKGVEEESFDPFMLEEGWKNTTMESARFVEFVHKHSDVDAIVIIGGTPELNRSDASRMASNHPKIFTASIFTPPDRHLLEDGVVVSAIISRTQASELRTPPKSPQEWFDRRYAVLTAGHGEASP